MKRQRFLFLGAVLMILLGVARGIGGLVLITQGGGVDPNIQAGDSAVFVVGAFLLLLGLALVVAAVGVFRRRRFFWYLGITGTVAFVLDGAINGYVLYGRPGDRGTVVNVIVAAIILVCLLFGKEALGGGAVQQDNAADDAARSP